jgi:urease accessory protein
MALGGALAMAGLPVPYTEEGILLSVLVLGILVTVAVRFPLPASMTIVGIFAFFHGHSHGVEMPAKAVGYAYGAGFILATGLLHTVGIGLAYAMHSVKLPVVRWAGAAIAVAGICLWTF